MFQLLNFPTQLTLIRLTVSVFVFPFLIVYFLPLNTLWINFSLVSLFIILALTDFLDGYLARRYKIETNLGKELDHIADKFFVTSILISLLAINKIYFFWCIILIIRELFILSLRLIAVKNNFTIPVAWVGKLKADLQYIMLGIIIANPDQHLTLMGSKWNLFEKIFIFLTILFTILSAIFYLNEFFKKYKLN